MDKKTFIRELRQALSVLQEDEMKDIINEYEQHIDMKMKNGLTEAEAIADFGSLPELTADILEAYHVRADYAADQKKEKKQLIGDDSIAAGRELLQQTKKGCRAAGEKAAYSLHRFGLWLWGVLMFWKKQLVKPFIFLKGLRQSRKRGRAIEGTRTAGRIGAVETGKVTIIHSVFRFAAGGICLGFKFACWSVRAAWNICCVSFALLCTGAGLLCLYILGLLVVLWMQHYPLAGVTVGCLGLVLCAFSAAGLCLTLVWRKRYKKTVGTDGPADHNREQDVFREETLMEKEDSAVRYQEMEGGQHA